MKLIPPGSTIGILGGGQLARMTAMAAARLGYKCHIFCANNKEPALPVSATYTIAEFSDKGALQEFASQVNVVTLEWENIPREALEIISKKVGVHPSANVLRIAQDRVEEKKFARELGLATVDFAVVKSVAELEKALATQGYPSILKSTRLGYDGKGQVKIEEGMDLKAAWAMMGSNEGILESFADFTCEVSVIVARRADGATAIYPVVQNIHRNGILFETHAPANIDKAVADEAEHLARALAEKLDVVGLLAVEMFVLKQPDKNGKRVLMNEIAPRPHNSGHWTIDACATSQFEQLVRAICGLPLGAPASHSRAVMRNLLGDDIKQWPELLKEPNACLHLYGKTEARPGRKMGHVTYLKGSW